jgi:cell division protein FtsW
MTRLTSFFCPTEATDGYLYHLKQSKIALANGGAWGDGLGEGQQKMHFLPAPHTDFIFAVLGEELGFAACFTVLLAYGGLIVAGLLVAFKTPGLFGSLLAGGLSLMLALGVFINIAVVTGSIPTTGLPLPLMSYGGSSLVTCMFSLGIILNIAKNMEGVQR